MGTAQKTLRNTLRAERKPSKPRKRAPLVKPPKLLKVAPEWRGTPPWGEREIVFGNSPPASWLRTFTDLPKGEFVRPDSLYRARPEAMAVLALLRPLGWRVAFFGPSAAARWLAAGCEDRVGSGDGLMLVANKRLMLDYAILMLEPQSHALEAKNFERLRARQEGAWSDVLHEVAHVVALEQQPGKTNTDLERYAQVWSLRFTILVWGRGSKQTRQVWRSIIDLEDLNRADRRGLWGRVVIEPWMVETVRRAYRSALSATPPE